MTANVSIETARHEALFLPSKAVEHEGEQTFVYISAPNGLQRKLVVIGAKDGETVEIKKGISQGDEILLLSVEAKNQPENTGQ
jgi:hypothetical protein